MPILGRDILQGKRMKKVQSELVLSKPAKITGIIASSIALAVMLGTGLVLAPEGTPLRKEVSSVVLPYFGQNWRVFAPNILKVNRTLEMRAQWRNEEGELVRSDWVSITDIEQRTAQGNMAPSRIEKSSWNASGTYLLRFNKLDEEQRERVQGTFIEQHDGGVRAIPVESLVEELGVDDPAVIRYLRMDYMFMRYMTVYATAGFDETIERVQWRIVRERPNDFVNRFNDDQQYTDNVTTFGWRQSNVQLKPSIVNEYRNVIERYGATHVFEKAAEDVS